ncbi:APC family permease [Galbitalea sp. SE-J8]|uniref:APC family permease n=1 Tax=Galbitalea sp. SE-J8 TaxID=3054952 RepID=UPI00259C7AB0|nr:APC family permease [Galbitalea sp. SE-J8]MDM4762217.1 APC family permease [Galbitalea sp. SE-J8]
MGVGSPLVSSDVRSPKRWLLGEPLPSEKLESQLLPKHLALPIFASDPLSSVAYAPQELLLILTLGGLSFLTFTPWIAAAVVVLLIVVVLSYRQLIRAYPSGGGDYEVARTNLGEKAGLVVASALLVDYVLTVAVSVASGVDNIISAFPALGGVRVELALGFIVLLIAINLRGVSESSKAFAVPTYLFIASVAVMVVVGLVRTAAGAAPVASSAHYTVAHEDVVGAGVLLLLLRAFASGCSALTGVEAIANGVQAFRTPKIRNAQLTLSAMGLIAICLFAGVTALALISGVHYAENACHLIGFAHCATAPQPSVMSQIAAAVFGGSTTIPFYIVQVATAAVLLLAANTAFNGFPLLGSVLSRDTYAPKSLSTRGDRLVYSNGVLSLGAAAAVLIVIYQASLTNLIQLYIIGVFVSFTLGQTGMVVHWTTLLRDGTPDRGAVIRSRIINTFGAALTLTVLVIVTITKFTHGAWLVFAIMPVIFVVLLKTNRYYQRVEQDIAADETVQFGANADHAIVLVGRLQKPILKALDYAIAARHDSLEAIHVNIDDEASARLEHDWAASAIGIPLRIVESPYRDISMPLIAYIKHHREEHGSEVITVYTPQFLYGHWWEGIFHNHKARRIRHKLMLCPGVTVALVPWLLDSTRALYTRTERPFPGQDRRGEPVRRQPLPRATARPGRR